jgi:hypothetical protein
VALRDGRLCAWVVERTPVRHAELARALALMLPVAAVPQAWMTVAQLPCTANGKLDRTALPDPPRTPSGAPPQPGRETLLTAAWCEALGLEQLGRDDPVRWWGADSLSALAVSVRLAERHGLAIPAQRLLATATVAEQAVLLETIAPAATLPPAANILASRQQVDWLDRAWFLHATGQPVPPFTAALTLRLSGHLDPDRLATALTAVVQSEPVLRTVFPLRPLPPRWLRPLLRWYTSLPRVARAGWRRLLAQRTPAAWPGRELPASPVPLPVTSGGLDDLPQTTAALAAAIDPHRGPLVAAHLTRLGAERHAFSLVFSHLAFDGGSAQTLLDRLWAAYRGEPLTPPAPSYRDWAAWDRTRTPSLPPETLAHLETVMRRWGPWPRLHLPSFARMATPCWRLAVRTLGADVLTPLRRLAAQARATPFQVLLAAYAVALRRITGHAEVAVTIATANRTHPQMLDRIGMFLTTGVVAVRLDADATCASVLPHVTASVERALAVQELTALDQAALGRAALPEAGALTGYFDVYAPLRVDPGIAGLDAEELDVVEPEPVEPHVVSALAVIQPRGLRLRLAHAADRLEPAIADRVLDAWVDALTAVG